MIHVTGCRILVKPIDLDDHDPVIARAKALGLTFTERTERQEKSIIDRGTVLEIGPAAHADYVGDVQVGDKIGYARYGGKYFKDGEEEFLVLNDEDIICVFKDNK